MASLALLRDFVDQSILPRGFQRFIEVPLAMPNKALPNRWLSGVTIRGALAILVVGDRRGLNSKLLTTSLKPLVGRLKDIKVFNECSGKVESVFGIFRSDIIAYFVGGLVAQDTEDIVSPVIETILYDPFVSERFQLGGQRALTLLEIEAHHFQRSAAHQRSSHIS